MLVIKVLLCNYLGQAIEENDLASEKPMFNRTTGKCRGFSDSKSSQMYHSSATLFDSYHTSLMLIGHESFLPYLFSSALKSNKPTLAQSKSKSKKYSITPPGHTVNKDLFLYFSFVDNDLYAAEEKSNKWNLKVVIIVFPTHCF